MLSFVGNPEGFLGSGAAGISEEGAIAQFMIQLQGVIVISLYTAIVTYVILKLVDLFVEVRASNEEEEIGLDMSEHNEQGYSL